MDLGHKITFYNNNITIEVWDEEEEIWVETPISELDYSFNRYMRHIVVFDENLTVKGFMTQLKPYQNLIEQTFEGSTYGYKLGPYLENMELNPDLGEDDIENVELYWVSELFDDDITEYISFHGYKKEGDEDVEGIPYSLAISPIKNWQNAKLFINNKYEIYNLSLKADGYKKPVVTATRDMTLYQLLDGWLFELSYHGYPENQEEFGDNLDEICNSIKNGEIETIRLEDAILDIKEEELQKEIDSENYERAEEIRKEIEELKNNQKDEDRKNDD